MAKGDLTTGSASRALYRLTAPMVLGVMSTILVQTLEIGFIGQLSTAHVAAITFTFPVTLILSSIALGVSIGTSSVIARSIGAGNHRDSRRLATHSLVLVMILGACLALLGWLLIDPLFTLLGAPPEMLPMIHDYLDIFYPSAVLFTGAMVASSILRASGNANLPGVVIALASVLHLILDPFLIFGWWGLPRMELAGAATALAVTRALTIVVLVLAVWRRRLMHPITRLAGMGNSAKRVLHVGGPAAATQTIGPLSAMLMTRLIADHGEVVVAAFGVATRIEMVAVIALFALSGSIGPFVGQNWGAGRLERVQAGMYAAYRFCLIWGLVAAGLAWLAGGVVSAWINQNPPVVATAALYLSIVPISYGAWGVLMMVSAAFNGLGKPIPSTILSFTRMFLVQVPLAILLNYWFGYVGIFAATAITNTVMGAVACWWFQRKILARKPQNGPS